MLNNFCEKGSKFVVIDSVNRKKTSHTTRKIYELL